MNRRAFCSLPLALAACKKGAGRKRIAVIPKATSHVFWITVQAGCRKAANEFDIELLWNGPAAETDYSRQVQIVDSMVSSGVDAVAVSASEATALIPPIDRAMAAGIPTVIFDSGLNSENYSSFIATDNVEGGRIAARHLAKLVGNEGPVAILMHTAGSVSSMDREKGFRETIEKEFPNIKIVAEQYGNSDRGRALAAAENILAAQPGLKGIFASTEPSAVGVSLALKARNLGGKIAFVGFDAEDTLIEDMKKGVVSALVVQDPFDMGYRTVKALVDAIKGAKLPKKVDMHARLVTADMLDQPEIHRLLHPEIDKYTN